MAKQKNEALKELIDLGKYYEMIDDFINKYNNKC